MKPPEVDTNARQGCPYSVAWLEPIAYSGSLPGHRSQPLNPILQRRVRAEQLHERPPGQRIDNEEVRGLRRGIERNALRGRTELLQGRRDRKSTRLNSSHI